MKIAVIGLGLIGGSLARAIKEHTGHTVIGFDISEQVLRFAKSVGAIDQIGSRADLSQADISFVCLYPDGVIDYILEHKDAFKKGSIVTDTAGVKSKICETLYGQPLPFTFLGGHPMAGREVSGFENSTPDLFEGASYIFTPPDSTNQGGLDSLRQLAAALHFGKTVVTTPEQHDRVIAYTSQIAHVLACAYVLSPTAGEHAGFSAGSFRDVSRVAKINESLWTQLFFDNQDALTAELDTLIENLQAMRGFLQAGDCCSLKDMLRQGREVKEALDK